MSMLESLEKYSTSFRHTFNLKILSNINTKITLYVGLAAYWIVILCSTFFGF